ncbi:hypothetical protein [Xenorhabdus bovienii]|uniref:hypothetical protein n=1 Tax=Xenorhabdus TaxID=626 RepID=UPI000AC62DD9|nr:hypothetical protein [Xenorhabdus bovienii]
MHARHGDGLLPVQRLISVRMNASLIVTWCDFSFIYCISLLQGSGLKTRSDNRS